VTSISVAVTGRQPRMSEATISASLSRISATPGMQERGYGRIVNIASNAAIGTALPGTTFYAATKAEVSILRI
jgi:NAD(P)-dependent dehydrogenase (short-subunit alcohol dehydrogenase family)